MNDRSALNQDLKKLVELQILKKLFEDNFFSYVEAGEDLNYIELTNRVFDITTTQGYPEFGTVYRSQLRDALGEIINAYHRVCDEYTLLTTKYPDLRFSILSGWREYHIYNDGLTGGILKVTASVRVAFNRTAVSIQDEFIVSAEVYLVDKYNYNYRIQSLDEWRIQGNVVVWKDIVQGNGFLNFILTKHRSTVTPMRVVFSTSTKQSFKPVPIPPPPGPGPFPPPGPAPYPPVPGPYPPGPLPPPHPPFPPPYPPVETVLIRQVVAERTVGGIKKDSILPAGLTFTNFVEWLLRGEEEIEEIDPTISLEFDALNMTLDAVITNGTAIPNSITFHAGTNKVQIAEYSANAETSTYIHQFTESAATTTEYVAVLHYTKSTGESETITSNPVTYYVQAPTISLTRQNTVDLVATITAGTAKPVSIAFYDASNLLETIPYRDSTNTYTHTLRVSPSTTTTYRAVLNYKRSIVDTQVLNISASTTYTVTGPTINLTLSGQTLTAKVVKNTGIPVSVTFKNITTGEDIQTVNASNPGATWSPTCGITVPNITTKYQAVLSYKRSNAQGEAIQILNSNTVVYSVVYTAAVPLGATPDEGEITSMTVSTINDSILSSNSGLRLEIPTSGGKTIFVAVPQSYESVLRWFASDGSFGLTPPTPYSVSVGGTNYSAYVWDSEGGYYGTQTIVLKK